MRQQLAPRLYLVESGLEARLGRCLVESSLEARLGKSWPLYLRLASGSHATKGRALMDRGQSREEKGRSTTLG